MSAAFDFHVLTGLNLGTVNLSSPAGKWTVLLDMTLKFKQSNSNNKVPFLSRVTFLAMQTDATHKFPDV